MSNLVYCPFCEGGGDPYTLEYLTGWAVWCQECDCETTMFKTKDEAVTFWNTRYSPENNMYREEMLRKLAK